MLICPNCGLKQEKSNFCGVCGTPLQNVAELSSSENTPEAVDVNVKLDNTENSTNTAPRNEQPIYEKDTVNNTQAATSEYKEKIQGYWSYFVACLKEPSSKLNISQFKWALTSTIIALLLWVLSPFWLINKAFSNINNGINSIFSFSNSSFYNLGFETFLRMLLLMGIVYLLTIALTYLLAKSMGTIHSWKETITHLGSYNAYIIAGFALILILLLLNSLIIAAILFSLISVVFLFFVPLYVVVSTFKNDYKLDKFIRYLITLGAFLVLYIIIYFFFFDKIANDLSNLNNYY